MKVLSIYSGLSRNSLMQKNNSSTVNLQIEKRADSFNKASNISFGKSISRILTSILKHIVPTPEIPAMEKPVKRILSNEELIVRIKATLPKLIEARKNVDPNVFPRKPQPISKGHNSVDWDESFEKLYKELTEGLKWEADGETLFEQLNKVIKKCFASTPSVQEPYFNIYYDILELKKRFASTLTK